MIQQLCRSGLIGIAVLLITVSAALYGFVAPAPTATASAAPADEVLVVDDSLEETGETACNGASHKSIGSAVSMAGRGDTVRVCSGTYSEQVTIDTPNLTVRADGDVTVNTANGWSFRINASGVTVHGFETYSTGNGGITIHGRNARILNTAIIAAEQGADRANSLTVGSTAARYIPGIYGPAFHETGGAQGQGIIVYADGALLRGVTVDGHDDGITVWGARNVTISESFVRDLRVDDRQDGVIVIGNSSATLIDNTITRNEDGVVASGNLTILRNNISGNGNDGVDIGPRHNVNVSGKTAHVRVLHNRIANNGYASAIGGNGILLRRDDWKRENIVITRNYLLQNANYGINNEEVVFDNDHIVVDAEGNFWGCGGPSSGLEDPVTHRIANGSGDAISPSGTPGVSNVHFDPFVERASCPTSGPTPSPTANPTSSATSTPTAVTSTPTATPGSSPTTATRTEPLPPASDDGAGPGGETGGPPSDDGLTGELTEDGTATASQTPTPPPTPTATPTPTLPPTATPTPREEPGFGVVAWLTAVVVLCSVLALRRRSRGADEG